MSLFKRLGSLLKAEIEDRMEVVDSILFKETKKKRINHEYEERQPRDPVKPSAPPTQEEEYYAILEIPLGSSFEDIKKAYRTLMRKYHPDRFQNDPSRLIIAEQITAKVNEAYQFFEQKFSRS